MEDFLDNLKYNNDQKYIVIDGESCNLNLGLIDNKAWQWGLLECKGKNIINEHNILINWPEINVSPEAAVVTRFDHAKVKREGIDPKKALDIVDSFIYNPEYLILFHNGLGFDIFLHNLHRKNLGIETDYSYLPRCLDTNALAKGIKKNFKWDKNCDFITYQWRLVNFNERGLKTNLTALGKENNIGEAEGIDYMNLHDATADVRLLWLIWNKWIKWNL